MTYRKSNDRHHFIMPSPVRPSRIMVDLQRYKQPWLAYCAAHQTTPSQALRLIIAKLLAAAAQNQSLAAEPHDASKDPHENQYEDPHADRHEDAPGCQTIRKEIRLTPRELRAAAQLAHTEGFSVTRWIAALVRARLEHTAQLGQHELELLARSNMHILALGRSLNQIARILHTSPEGMAAVPPELVEGTHKAVREHAALVARVLAANRQRWSRS